MIKHVLSALASVLLASTALAEQQGAGPLESASPLQGAEPSLSAGPLESTSPLESAGPLQNAGPLAAVTPLQMTGPIQGAPLEVSSAPPAGAIPSAPVAAMVSSTIEDVRVLKNLLSTPEATTPEALSSMVVAVTSSQPTTSSPVTNTTSADVSPSVVLAPVVYNTSTSSNLSPN